jgi:hypothetical protein
MHNDDVRHDEWRQFCSLLAEFSLYLERMFDGIFLVQEPMSPCTLVKVTNGMIRRQFSSHESYLN